jgi:hypothetical protein
MKLPILSLAVIIAALFTANAAAEDQPAGCKCEMMKKHDSAPAAVAQMSEAQADLNKLVTEMNGNIGAKKLEAMAAIITRLVEQANAKAPTALPESDAPKSEAHHH